MKKALSTTMAGFLLLASSVFLLMSCGGGGDEVALSSIPGFSAGTLTKGSVIVNGVEFTAGAGATVKVDDNPGTETELHDGMQVKVKGRIDNNGTTGTFEKVEAEPEVQGKLLGKGLDDFLVNGQRVAVDDLTKMEHRNAAGALSPLTFTELANTNEVEVHGMRDAAGRIHATRVERHAVEDGVDEVKGKVAAPIVAGTSFTLVNGATSIIVNFAGTTFSPAGKTEADLLTGVLVEVHGAPNAFDPIANTFAATRIDFEAAEDGEFEPAEGQHFRREGLISGFTGHPGAFTVGGVQVQTSSATKLLGGVEADLANNIKVQVEGHKAGTAMVVEKLKFKDSVRIEANVTAVAADGTSITVLGKTVKLMSTTEINNGPPATAGGVKVRGFAAGSSITAIRVDVTNSVSKSILRGPVAAKTPTTSMDITGITVNMGAGAIFRDANEQSISASAFFNNVKTTAPATIVKAKGDFDGTVLTAEEVELEESF